MAKKSNTNVIRQSVLGKAIVNYFRPTYYFKSISKIDLKYLRDVGIKNIICDLDNTLVPHYIGIPQRKTINFINEAKQNNINFFIASNNTGKRVERFSKNLSNLDGFYSNIKKPLTMNLTRIMAENDMNIKNTIMIGDQLEMDILAANILHLNSILVEPLFDESYNYSNLTRFIEKFIYKRLARFNALRKGEYSSLESNIDNKIL
ncbi:MAG: HAD hydrolase-like protein [Mycoplasmataceae bacterium]|nr:HAD hydrolase-like protein [Mycoplasmataceae bacterium]